jgi:hypothetical protein
MTAARGSIRIMLSPACVPADAKWLERLARSFADEKVAVVVSRVRIADRARMPLSARAMASVLSPELDAKSAEPAPLEVVSHLCDAYRADALEKAGCFANPPTPSPAEAVDISIKITSAGRRIILSPDATVLYTPPPDLSPAGGLLRRAMELGHADATLSKMHGVDWLGTRVFAVAILSLVLVPVGLVSLPIGVMLAGLLFLAGWFLAVRLPLLRWEVPVALWNLAVYAAIVISIRRDWARSVFDPAVWHPAAIRQWCILVGMTASDVLFVMGAGAWSTMSGVLRGYVRGPAQAAGVFVLAIAAHIATGIGYIKGYVASRAGK